MLAGQVRPGALEGGGGGRVRRYVRLAGHDKFTAWLTICPPRAAFGTEPLVHPRGGRGGEGGSMQTRRLLFKLNAATSEEDSLPGPLELGELPFISKRVGGGRLSLQASRRRRFFRISLLFLLVVARTLSSLPMDHTGFFGLGLKIYRWKEAFCVFVVFWLSNFGERINLGTPCLRFRKC